MENVKVNKQIYSTRSFELDPRHYTIYERYQNISHPLDGDEKIYEIWMSWGENRDKIQFKLKLNKEYCSTLEKDHHQKDKVIFFKINLIFKLNSIFFLN